MNERKHASHLSERDGQVHAKPFDVVLAFFAALTSVAGLNVASHADLFAQATHPIYVTVIQIITATFALLFAYWFFSWLWLNFELPEPLDRFVEWTNSGFGKAVLIILLVCLPLFLLLAYYPGVSSYDTYYQYDDFFDGSGEHIYASGNRATVYWSLSDHHPFLTTLLFGFFFQLGRNLGNESLGFALYVLCQIALWSVAYLSVISLFSRDYRKVAFVSIAYYAFNLFLAQYEINMLKDSLYTPLLLLYCVSFLRVCSAADRRKDLVWLCVLTLILPFAKKTGVYLVLISNAALLVSLLLKKAPAQKSIALVATTLVCALTMFFVLPKIVFPAFQIFPGGKQESLATLFQQTARMKIDHPEVYSSEDAEALERVIGFSELEERYDPELYDKVKNSFKLETVTDADLKRFYAIWLKAGLAHPETYLNATLGTNNGYFAPTKQLEVYTENQVLGMTENPVALFLREGVEALRNFIYATPILNAGSFMVIYCWWIPLAGLARLVEKRGWGSIVALVPVFVSVLIVVVSPYSFARYALPLVALAPMSLFAAEGLESADRGARNVEL